MKIDVKLFAAVAEKAGASSVTVEFQHSSEVTIREIKKALVEKIPQLHEMLEHCFFARGDDYATPETVVFEGDTIAIIPPVSGGELAAFADATVRIVREPLSSEAMYQAVVRKEAGAVVVFAGTVREFTKGRQTKYLQYEAYDEMAIRQMQQIVNDSEARFKDSKMSIWHRVGDLQLEDISVLIGVSTPHRKDAFRAAEEAITTLKRTVPIWKKEFYADGEVEWVGPDGVWDPTKHE
ncbi:MAG: molybdenum cofactor biosynthesis protein MoaE [Acidibacillus sp.]|uniref:Molybdopterin synthase catalytic subunit n=1 Tax=Sulfoacidibacillus ferrooxidans TaxID=2005001 RepID=A0A9X1VA37_9BACL|nr:hypothetical protein [Sulfoacidibacillus ferrooxidans]MCY0893574.1 molybdenum cofactor biosynthesis protein MoaE [Acidibacillus sp.]